MDADPDDSQPTSLLLPSNKKNQRRKERSLCTILCNAAKSILRIGSRTEGHAYTALRSSDEQDTYKPPIKKPKRQDKPSATKILKAAISNTAASRSSDNSSNIPLHPLSNQSSHEPSTEETGNSNTPSATKNVEMQNLDTSRRSPHGPRCTSVSHDDDDFRVDIPDTVVNQDNEDAASNDPETVVNQDDEYAASNAPDTARYIQIDILCVKKPCFLNIKYFYFLFGVMFVVLGILFILIQMVESSEETRARVITGDVTD
ncbi:hypothetical protein BZA77DRAFT_356243 [Pyronema omphalodes]|nr:hypothetical protein BZA77DRAFT_356243 [Pyronema omphalodes]